MLKQVVHIQLQGSEGLVTLNTLHTQITICLNKQKKYSLEKVSYIDRDLLIVYLTTLSMAHIIN
jgi:hypothetical protein